VEISGNTKLRMSAKGSDFRVLQGISTGISMFRTTFDIDKEIKLSKKSTVQRLECTICLINGSRVGTSTEDESYLR